MVLSDLDKSAKASSPEKVRQRNGGGEKTIGFSEGGGFLGQEKTIRLVGRRMGFAYGLLRPYAWQFKALHQQG